MIAPLGAARVWAQSGAQTPWPAPPPVAADAAILLDVTTGQVLYQKNAHQRRDPASTTKIMTALLALEMADPDEWVVVSRRAAGTPGSSMHLRTGERYPLADLLRGLMLVSGNDAAVAIAEHLAGNPENFALMMTGKARALGLRDTRFKNPHGMTARGHVTSAHDLAVLARHAQSQPAFARVVCRGEGAACGIDRRGQPIRKSLRNTNRLLFTYQWSDGVKTGTTAAAGNCLVASATRYGQQLIAVVLHANNRWDSAQRLLDYGFSRFALRQAAPAGEVVREVLVKGALRPVPLVPSHDLWVVLPRGDLSRARTVIHVNPALTAPLPMGERVGSLTMLRGREVLGRVPLVTARAAPAMSWWQRLLGMVYNGSGADGP